MGVQCKKQEERVETDKYPWSRAGVRTHELPSTSFKIRRSNHSAKRSRPPANLVETRARPGGNRRVDGAPCPAAAPSSPRRPADNLITTFFIRESTGAHSGVSCPLHLSLPITAQGLTDGRQGDGRLWEGIWSSVISTTPMRALQIPPSPLDEFAHPSRASPCDL
ncbi:hypothetical protein Bbelb_286560 [Branchiostoma belcheri]|nr:hypothetical protein Bbelb_286560 [Branchiostoma belcheri]